MTDVGRLHCRAERSAQLKELFATNAASKVTSYTKCRKTKRKVNEISLEMEVTTDTTSAETVEFLDTVDAVASGTPWVIKVQLNNRDLEFKVDTGADVIVL